jgi:hypothetical protein
MMFRVITQYGRNTMYFMSRSNSGVRRPTWSRPTTTFIVNDGVPVVPRLSNAYSWNDGTLTTMNGVDRSSGSQRMRSIASSICRARRVNGTLIDASVVGPSTLSGASPWRAWNRATAPASTAS